MLTKELLCFRTSKGEIIPKLINPEAKNNLAIAEELLDVFSNSIGDVREKLEEATKQILGRYEGNTIVVRGLEKILFDRTEFDTESRGDLIKLREQVFNCSSKLLKSKMGPYSKIFETKNDENLSFYQNEISSTIKLPLENLMRNLYGDLPPFQKVLRFKKMSSSKLLHRYNCAQVQGLLLRCERVTLYLENSDFTRLRQMIKYLRFNKLLAKISPFQEKDKTLILEIDGPLSMFLNTQKYGLNLANFFPSILLQSHWRLNADVKIKKNKTHTLNLDQSCGIISHYKQFLAYVPEEIEKLSKKLTEKLPDWKLTPSSDYIHLGGEVICFPDYSLEHCSGMKVHMELFHPWHSKPLLKRLEQVEMLSQVPLIIGIDRSLLKNNELVEQINSSKNFLKFGFYFREAPSVSKISGLLEFLLKN